MRTEQPAEVKSAARILDLLEMLGTAPAPLRHAEIARQLEMPKSSATALLETLVGRGYVALGADGYQLVDAYREGGWALGELGIVLRAARPAMQRLAQVTGESAFLAVAAHDWQVRYVEKVVSENPLRYDIAIGTLRPAHSTSVGRVLLAGLPDELVDAYVASDRISKITSKTETNPRAIRRAIDAVRERGHALISDSSVLGASGVAAPIRDAAGAVVAAVCVIAPTPRFEPAAPDILRAVADCAERVSAALAQAGHAPTRRKQVWKT